MNDNSTDESNFNNDSRIPFAPSSDELLAKEHAKLMNSDEMMAREMALREREREMAGGVVITEKQYYQPPPEVEKQHRVENLQPQPQRNPPPQRQYNPPNNQEYNPYKQQQQQQQQNQPQNQPQYNQRQYQEPPMQQAAAAGYNQQQQYNPYMQQQKMPMPMPQPQPQPVIVQQQQVYVQPVYQPQTMVIRTGGGLPGAVRGRFPQNFQCNVCNRPQFSQVSYKIGTGGLAWIIGCLFFCPCASFGPCCSNDCQDVTHTCPGCGRTVGEEKWLC